MRAVPYFTAVMARAGSVWKARDVVLDEAGTLPDLADELRAVAFDDEPVLALLEHEDEWFAIVRVDADDDPRLFVSDLPAASAGGYAEVLAPAAEVVVEDDDPVPAPAASDPDADADSEDGSEDDEEPPPVPPAVWAGDPELLEDLGVPADDLRRLAVDEADPAVALAAVGDRLGFADLIEALR